uniref:Putative secreted protein n=1 Tax=Anopheles darlingi TaxID=43151 RepID=A0A2M4DCK7_ANODA
MTGGLLSFFFLIFWIQNDQTDILMNDRRRITMQTRFKRRFMRLLFMAEESVNCGLLRDDQKNAFFYAFMNPWLGIDELTFQIE